MAPRQDLCRRCSTNQPFCDACIRRRVGTACVPPAERIPPCYFDKITYTPLKSAYVGCAGQGRKQLLIGSEGEVLQGDVDRVAALEWAERLFTALVALLCQNPHIGSRNDRPGLPNAQDTMAITLLESGDHYRLILTYSEYDKTHVPNAIKSKHETLKKAVIDAEPALRYDKAAQRHWIKEAEQWKPYPIHKQNLHHAEMRAYRYAGDRGYAVVQMLPTRECCEMCQGGLGDALKFVPFWLRKRGAPLRTLDEEAGTLLDEERGAKFGIQAVPGDGNCLFHALIAAGISLAADAVAAADADGTEREKTLRRGIADGLALGADDDLRRDRVAVDTTRLPPIAALIGRRIVLYEAHYGEREWTERSESGQPDHAPIYLLVRSVRGQGEAHYDLLMLS